MTEEKGKSAKAKSAAVISAILLIGMGVGFWFPREQNFSGSFLQQKKQGLPQSDEEIRQRMRGSEEKIQEARQKQLQKILVYLDTFGPGAGILISTEEKNGHWQHDIKIAGIRRGGCRVEIHLTYDEYMGFYSFHSEGWRVVSRHALFPTATGKTLVDEVTKTVFLLFCEWFDECERSFKAEKP